jgi:hypothetical protein
MFHDGGKLPGEIEKQFENFDNNFNQAVKRFTLSYSK